MTVTYDATKLCGNVTKRHHCLTSSREVKCINMY